MHTMINSIKFVNNEFYAIRLLRYIFHSRINHISCDGIKRNGLKLRLRIVMLSIL